MTSAFHNSAVRVLGRNGQN